MWTVLIALPVPIALSTIPSDYLDAEVSSVDVDAGVPSVNADAGVPSVDADGDKGLPSCLC